MDSAGGGGGVPDSLFAELDSIRAKVDSARTTLALETAKLDSLRAFARNTDSTKAANAVWVATQTTAIRGDTLNIPERVWSKLGESPYSYWIMLQRLVWGQDHPTGVYGSIVPRVLWSGNGLAPAAAVWPFPSAEYGDTTAKHVAVDTARYVPAGGWPAATVVDYARIADSIRAAESDSLAVKFSGSTTVRDSLDSWAKNDTISFVTNASTVTVNYDSIAGRVNDTLTARHGSGTWGAGVGGSNVTAFHVRASTDSTAVPTAIVSGWSLDYGSEYCYGVTGASGNVTISLPETVAIQIERVGYTSYFDTLYLSGASTVTTYITPLSIPVGTSPARCAVFGYATPGQAVGGHSANYVPPQSGTVYLAPGTATTWIDSVAVSPQSQGFQSDTTGLWTVQLIRGATYRIDIPKFGIYVKGVVPDSTSYRVNGSATNAFQPYK
jgi:hypothetical protein